MKRRILSMCCVIFVACALNNTQGKTPPMGFNPWTAFGSKFNETVLLEVAEALLSLGLADVGYKYINLDCGWTTGKRERATGNLQVDRSKFPNMSHFSATLHSMGMKFGAYAGGWRAQCCHRGDTGNNDTSWQHWDTDVALFKSWNIDYLKSDPCCGHDPKITAPLTPAQVFNEYNMQWDAAFQRAGYLNHVFIQGSGPGRATGDNTSWPRLLNSWRTTADVKPTFDSVMHNIHENDQYADIAGPHHFNDADMLQCGQPGISLAECRTVLSLWSIAKSPLLIGADPRTFRPEVVELLSNREVIAVSQDPMGQQGRWRRGAGRWAEGTPANCSAAALPRQFNFTRGRYIEAAGGSRGVLGFGKACGRPGGPAYGKLTVAQAQAVCCSLPACAGFSWPHKIDAGDAGAGCFKMNSKGGVVVKSAYDGYQKGGSTGPGQPTAPEVWSGALQGSRFAVAVVNLDANTTQTATVSWSDALPGAAAPRGTRFAVRDLWNRADLGTHVDVISLEVGPHDTRLLILSPVAHINHNYSSSQ